MSDTLRARVTEYMYGHGDADRAIEAAEAEVARRDEQHAKEREAVLERADIDKAKAVERERRLAETEKQAAVAAALAAEKERVKQVAESHPWGKEWWGLLERQLYPSAKVTLLPAGPYWIQSKANLSQGSTWQYAWRTEEFEPQPSWEYIKAKPPPNPYAKAAEPYVLSKGFHCPRCAAGRGNPFGDWKQGTYPVAELCDACTKDANAAEPVKVTPDRVQCPNCKAFNDTDDCHDCPYKRPASKPTLAEWKERNNSKKIDDVLRTLLIRLGEIEGEDK